ncbi:MAG TPA: hypothetical protein VIK30_12405, partial [Polyangia bacterium]
GGTGTTTGAGGSSGTTFGPSDFFIGVQQVPGVNLTILDAGRFFNKAHCECSTPVQIFVALQPTSVSKRLTVPANNGTMAVVLGTNCNNILVSELGNCTGFPNGTGTEKVTTFLNNTSFTIMTDARFLSTDINPTPGVDGSAVPIGCDSNQQFPQTITALFDFDGDGTFEVSASTSLNIDLLPPTAPTGVTIQGGDEALSMNWQALDTSVVNDLLGYQILCSRADQYQVFKESGTDGGATGPFNAGFLTCPATQAASGLLGVEGLDPTFVCSPLLSADTTSYRVRILQNDITYAAAVVAVDNSGNASAPIVGYGKPIKTLSFYEVYRNENPQDAGGASGGFCALATSRPRLTSTLGALLAFGIGGIGVAVARRRRRGRR